MREFFRSRKRKAGCVTLAMSCLFVGLWVRSGTTVDIIATPSLLGIRLLLLSFPNGVSPGVVFDDQDSFLPAPPTKVSNFHNLWFSFPSDDPWMKGHPRIPHAIVVTPLILLSVYLILSKPRAKQKHR